MSFFSGLGRGLPGLLDGAVGSHGPLIGDYEAFGRTSAQQARLRAAQAEQARRQGLLDQLSNPGLDPAQAELALINPTFAREFAPQLRGHAESGADRRGDLAQVETFPENSFAYPFDDSRVGEPWTQAGAFYRTAATPVDLDAATRLERGTFGVIPAAYDATAAGGELKAARQRRRRPREFDLAGGHIGAGTGGGEGTVNRLSPLDPRPVPEIHLQTEPRRAEETVQESPG